MSLRIKDFRLLSIIGQGGFGTVGKYSDNFAQRICAIKVIKINSSPDLDDVTSFREVNAMLNLKNPFVVQYYNSWIENKKLYIQMEYCFDNLKTVLSIKPNIFERSENQAMNSIEFYISCEILRQITEGLNYLHSLPKPLIHRDLKPENILIGMSGNRRICKLADFGFSKFIEDHSDYHTIVGATHRYRAPEIASAHRYDYKVDIYSLGMIALEIFELDTSIVLDGKLEKCNEFITNFLITPKRHQRVSCNKLLTEIKTWKLSISNKKEITTYVQKFQDMNLPFFADTLSWKYPGAISNLLKHLIVYTEFIFNQFVHILVLLFLSPILLIGYSGFILNLFGHILRLLFFGLIWLIGYTAFILIASKYTLFDFLGNRFIFLPLFVLFGLYGTLTLFLVNYYFMSLGLPSICRIILPSTIIGFLELLRYSKLNKLNNLMTNFIFFGLLGLLTIKFKFR